MIRIENLTKRYGSVLGVDDLSFEVRPGQVTGFLGPNGSGKTTTLRILLGLASPTAGTATIGGLPYHQLRDPVRQVGAALDSNTFHPGRSAAQHLRIIATVTGLPRRRVDEVLGLTGLAPGPGPVPSLPAAVAGVVLAGTVLAGYGIVMLLAANRTTIRRDVS
jgi:ABC-2 type transport system ATP-binding protein